METLDTEPEELTYTQAVAHNLEGLSFVSTGPCPGCDECRELYGYDSQAEFDAACECGDIAVEPHFSWHWCDICGSTLGGDREEWHGVDSDGATIHFNNACTDCVCYLANGDVPEGAE